MLRRQQQPLFTAVFSEDAISMSGPSAREILIPPTFLFVGQSKAQVVGEENRKFQKNFYCFRHNELKQGVSQIRVSFSAQMRKFIQ